VAVGIEAINAYVGRASMDARELFERRELDMRRFANLMMEQKSVNLPCEDAVTNAVNAARPIVDALDPAERDRIELVLVGTESGCDFGKSVSTYVHHHLGLGRRCRSFEVKHACYGGTAALQAAAAVVAASPVLGVKALVVATDAPPTAGRGTYLEPSGGTGAVAMLVSDRPLVLELDAGASGYHSFEVMDTLRPAVDVDLVDPDLSMLSYMHCLEQSFEAYRERVSGADIVDTFDYLAFHTPFGGMVRGAHRMLLRKQGHGLSVDDDFEARVRPSLAFCMRVGNIFSASLYLALCSLVDRGDLSTARRVGLFSYGSGCASEFYSGVVPETARDAVGRRRIGVALDERRPLTMDEYETIAGLDAGRRFGIRDCEFDTRPYGDVYASHFQGRRLLVIDRIDNFHRLYRWS